MSGASVRRVWATVVGVGVGVGLAALGGAVAGYTQGGLVAGVGGLVGGGLGYAASAFEQRRSGRAAARRARGLVLEPLPPHADPVSGRPSDLLLAERRVVGFRGRRAEMALLREWLDSDRRLMVVTGPADVGKTRLAVEFAADLPEGWVGGRLRPGREVQAAAAVEAAGDPTLVVAEAAGTGPGLASFLTDVQAAGAGPPVKVLLVCRGEAWLAYLRTLLPEVTAGMLDDAARLPVEARGSGDDLARWYAEAADAFASRVPTPRPAGAAPRHRLGTTIGELHARALMAVSSDRPTAGASLGEVSAWLAEHERRQWPSPEPPVGDRAVQDRCVAVLGLLGAADETGAADLLRAVPDLADAGEQRRRQAARWVAGLYPSDTGWAGMPRPDLLAHTLLLQPLLDSPELADAVLKQVTPAQLPRAVQVLASAANYAPAALDLLQRVLLQHGVQDAPAAVLPTILAADEAGRVDRILELLVTAGALSADQLDQLDTISRDSAVLLRTRVAVLQHRVTQAQSDTDPARLAAVLNDLAAGLDGVGRYDEALTAYQEAVALWHELDTANPTVHRPGLAHAVGDLGVVLDRVGRYDEALTASEEAVSLWRDLDTADPTVHRPGLAHAVDSLGAGLDRVGRYDEALTAKEEAVSLWRDLDAADLTVHRLGLAHAVVNLGIGLDRVGRYDEALTADVEAVALWRELADGSPTVHRPRLAHAVDSLGVGLDRVGHYDEALTAKEEAVSLWRDLDTANPTVHRPHFAYAVDSLGVGLDRVGHYDEALTAKEEAVSLWRDLDTANPTVHRPGLARAVGNLGVGLDGVGRYDEALTADQEAVSLWRDLDTANPTVHRPDLAKVVRNLGGGLNRVGRHDEALTAIEEAVGLWRDLDTANPTVHRPRLATAVGNLGVVLERVGRHDEALTAYREAVGLWRGLADGSPRYESDLGTALDNLRTALRRQGREDEIITEGLPVRGDPRRPPE